MVVRGRLAFDDQGRLVEIAEDAADPNNPQPSEIDPVEFDQLIAATASITSLGADIDADGNRITNLSAVITSRVTPDSSIRGYEYDLLTIADDSTSTLDGQSVPKMEVVGRSTNVGVGIFFMGFDTLTTIESSGISNQGSTSLSGTTGPDGTLNIARDGNTIIFENRTGMEESYLVERIGVS